MLLFWRRLQLIQRVRELEARVHELEEAMRFPVFVHPFESHDPPEAYVLITKHDAERVRAAARMAPVDPPAGRSNVRSGD